MPRPDSSAARAAAIQGLSTTTAASPKNDKEDDEPEPATAKGGHDRTGNGHNVHGDSQAAGDAEPSAAKKPKKSRRGLWVTLAIILAVVLAGGAVTYVMYQRVKDTYYVTADNSQIKVMNGTDSSVMGLKLNSVHQDVCLDDEGKATFVDPGAGGDCHLFKTSDLTPAAQGALSDLPEDSYDKVTGQVNRLAEQTLPVCVTRVPADGGKSGSDKGNEDDKAKDKKDSKDNSKKSEAPEDLTTPGVSCREVK